MDILVLELEKLNELGEIREGLNSNLIFTMLGERVTTEISQKEKPETFNKNKTVAKRGGKVAGTARKQTEDELGRSVVTKQNNLYKIKEVKDINE